jgi:hypothetical protein
VRPVVLAACCLFLLVSRASAAEDEAVNITALRDPVDKSYRKMVKGMALFEARHAAAPGATLRYRLLPRRPDTDMRGIAVSVVGDSFERPVRVAADATFALDFDRTAVEEDASVRPNRKAGTLTWRADIRSPGLPPGTRRLGDLRLECRVGMEAGLVSQYPSLFDRMMDFVLGADRFCDEKEPPYLFFAGRPLFAVTLVHGERRETLSVGALYAGLAHDRAPDRLLSYCDCAALLDRAYYVPLGDRSWPDDTRVQLESMDEPPAASDYANLVGSSKAEMAEIFGRGKEMRFAGSREVWAYDYGQAELVMLFDAAGRVAKARMATVP